MRSRYLEIDYKLNQSRSNLSNINHNQLSLKCLDWFELAPYGKFDGIGSIAIKRIDDLARVHSVKFKIVWEIFKVTVNL